MIPDREIASSNTQLHEIGGLRYISNSIHSESEEEKWTSLRK